MAFAYRAKPLGGRDENDADENHNVLNEIGVRRTEIPQNPAELLQYYKDRIGACFLGDLAACCKV